MRRRVDMNFATACDRALRFTQLGRDGQQVRLVNSIDCGTHWLLTFGVQSLEIPSRDFMKVHIVAEKRTGFLYISPSRTRRGVRLDKQDFKSVLQSCTLVTPDMLLAMEEEEKKNPKQPKCWACGSLDVHCDGGHAYDVANIDGEFIRWVHTCGNCDRQTIAWLLERRDASKWRCPHFLCKQIQRTENG